MSEFLNNGEYRDVSSDKQDCERKAFYRFAERIKKRFPKLKISVTMDGLYACGPIIKTCREYGWDYMLVFKEGSMKDAWREAMGLIRLTPENILKRHYGGRNQDYRWINDVEYTLINKVCLDLRKRDYENECGNQVSKDRSLQVENRK